MGEEEDGMAPRPSTSTSQSLMTPQNTYGNPNNYHHHFDVNMLYPPPPPPSNPENFRQEYSEFSECEENVRSTFSDAADDEDLEGTTVVPDDEVRVEAPRSGMEFESDKELIAYYKQYAKQERFGVRTQRTKRDDDGRPVYVTIGCAHGGKYQPKNRNISKPRPTIKTDCKAKVNATLNKNNKWVITTVDNAHNHMTVSPKKTRLDEYSQRILNLNDRAGIRMNKNYHPLVVDAGGFENLHFQEKDCRNYIDKARHLRLGKGGGEALNEFFQRMRYQNDGFVFNIDVDDEGRLRNVFWADARSRAAYEYFGDVVTFDTTYLTNRYGMPFALFVGVNHHGQSILLGAGLLSSEDTHSFVWLFRMWLSCMNGRAPKAIITDQDRAMKNAIANVLPETRHRYCLWHIMRKLPEKLGSHSQFSTGLKTSIQAALYDSQTCTEFEERWGQLVDKYDLRGNNWLESLYEERTFWVPVYMKDVFWAGMSTTQQSESMNAFFDGYVHFSTTLKEFVDQFDNALRKKVEVETTADFNSSNQTIPCVSPFNFEKQFQSVYTIAKFKELQKELMGLMCCNCTLVSKQGCISTFDILDEIYIDDCTKTVHYTIYYNEDECKVKCTCALFEMRGILCRHALRVFQLKRINVIPDRYVLDRWRKDEKRRYTLIKSSYDDLWASGDAQRYEMVVKRCMKLATKISPSDERVNAFLRYVDEFDSKCDDVTFGSKFESTKVGPNVAADKGKKILSPNLVQEKGRPPSKREVPLIEKMTRKRKACLDDETQLGDIPGSQHQQFDDGVGLGTQNSIVEQSMPSGNQEKDGPGPRNGARYVAPFKEQDLNDDEENCVEAGPFVRLSTPTCVLPGNCSSSALAVNSALCGTVSESCLSETMQSDCERLPATCTNDIVSKELPQALGDGDMLPAVLANDDDNILSLIASFMEDATLISNEDNKNEDDWYDDEENCVEAGPSVRLSTPTCGLPGNCSSSVMAINSALVGTVSESCLSETMRSDCERLPAACTNDIVSKELPQAFGDEDILPAVLVNDDDNVFSVLASFMEDAPLISNEDDKNKNLSHVVNIEAAHVDIYEDLEDLGNTASLSKNGYNIYNSQQAIFPPDLCIDITDLDPPLDAFPGLPQ